MMETLTEKKRKWIIRHFRSGRSVTSIARTQKVSRQHVYRLARRFKKEGTTAYKVKKAGRHSEQISPNFAKKVVELNNRLWKRKASCCAQEGRIWCIPTPNSESS